MFNSGGSVKSSNSGGGKKSGTGGKSTVSKGVNLSSADKAAVTPGAVRNQKNGSFGGGSVSGYANQKQIGGTGKTGAGFGGGGGNGFGDAGVNNAASRVRSQKTGGFQNGSDPGFANAGLSPTQKLAKTLDSMFATNTNKDQARLPMDSPIAKIGKDQARIPASIDQKLINNYAAYRQAPGDTRMSGVNELPFSTFKQPTRPVSYTPGQSPFERPTPPRSLTPVKYSGVGGGSEIGAFAFNRGKGATFSGDKLPMTSIFSPKSPATLLRTWAGPRTKDNRVSDGPPVVDQNSNPLFQKTRPNLGKDSQPPLTNNAGLQTDIYGNTSQIGDNNNFPKKIGKFGDVAIKLGSSFVGGPIGSMFAGGIEHLANKMINAPRSRNFVGDSSRPEGSGGNGGFYGDQSQNHRAGRIDPKTGLVYGAGGGGLPNQVDHSAGQIDPKTGRVYEIDPLTGQVKTTATPNLGGVTNPTASSYDTFLYGTAGNPQDWYLSEREKLQRQLAALGISM